MLSCVQDRGAAACDWTDFGLMDLRRCRLSALDMLRVDLSTNTWFPFGLLVTPCTSCVDA
jgi:hypothetical protein